MTGLQGARIHVTGVVQGVGFRPLVYQLAERFSVTGWVRNTSAGVELEIDGTPDNLTAFIAALEQEAPPLARVEGIQVEERPPDGYTSFEILASEAIPGAFQPVSPDVSLCADCRRELFDPTDRRYRYPFTNCTNCGPRFTIIVDIPYDRPNTTMAEFEMCAECAAEYHDPRDRRFHAQPVACPVCGPNIWLEVGGVETARGEDALQAARESIRDGQIIAVKGLGGFHLACDATNATAVDVLRKRKMRVDKAFALMMPDFETVERHCILEAAERNLLLTPERPIVIVPRKSDSSIAPGVAPGQNTVGVMLPYTPLHELILQPEPGFPEALVMTSGNLSEEPIATGNQEARDRLSELADAFLFHDRGIQTRCDDSVLRVFEGLPYPIRRSRGYAPYPVPLSASIPPILAVGGEMKNVFCLTQDGYAFLSHYIGEMENYETLQAFEQGIDHYQRLFRIQPQFLAYDLHPDYLATQYALGRSEQEGIPAIGIQHHHAHIVSCMTEHGIATEERVIGLSFDGTGYGDDGAIWGGEVLLAGYREYERVYHLEYCPLLGGDQAVREPWRYALAWLNKAGIEWSNDLAPVAASSEEARAILAQQIETGINAPMTSSMGRLFDAVSSLVGCRQSVNYEAQAAIELEALVDPVEVGAYTIQIQGDRIDPTPMFHEIVSDQRAGMAVGTIAARFHNGIVFIVQQISSELRTQYGIEMVVLSGGVWQNMTLLEGVVNRLRMDGFDVRVHRQVPANDGGLALGQAMMAASSIEAQVL